MEFRLPNDEHNPSSFPYSPPPPPPPSSSTSTYFTEQALRMGYFSNGIRTRTDFVRNSDRLREEIQIELEKERIREAIIAAEILRKQADLRRQMVIERGLVVPRAEFRPPLLHHQNHYSDDPRFHRRSYFSSSPEFDSGFLFGQQNR